MKDASRIEEAGQPETGTTLSDLHAALDAERAAADHWRDIARRRGAALDAIRHRTAVRALLALERRARPLRDRMVRAQERLADPLAQSRLVARALPTRPRLPSTRTKLLAAVRDLPMPPSPRGVSIVMITDGAVEIDSRTRGGPGADTEVIVVSTGRDGDLEGADRVIDGTGLDPVSAAMLGADAANRELLCFLAPTTEPLEDGWLARLAAEIGGRTVAATPTLVHPERPLRRATPHDLRVRMSGLDVALNDEGVPAPRGRDAGADVSPQRPAIDVAAGSAACLLVDRAAYEAAGGFTLLEDLDAAAFELCLDLRERGGSVVVVPSAIAFDHRPVSSVADLATPIPGDGPEWRAVIEHHGPALVHSLCGLEREPPTFALTVAAPSVKMAHRWGDWHLALALERSLRRLGHRVLVQTSDRADDLSGRSCDIHVVLRGLAPVRRTPGQRHVLWVISHPEQVDDAECDAADLVLVASHRFARELRERTSTPVEVLLQATDHRRFRPLPADPAHAHPIVVVAKSREILRPAVADALAAGLRPAIYGSGWEGLVDPELVVADYLANEELPAVYSSAGVLLSDHWGTMRAWGFVSNRLFDALACGTPVISDHLPEVHDLFGDAVPTYRSPEELRKLVDADLEDPMAARERASAGRRTVLAAHTFDHRTRDLLDALRRHRITRTVAAS